MIADFSTHDTFITALYHTWQYLAFLSSTNECVLNRDCVHSVAGRLQPKTLMLKVFKNVSMLFLLNHTLWISILHDTSILQSIKQVRL